MTGTPKRTGNRRGARKKTRAADLRRSGGPPPPPPLQRSARDAQEQGVSRQPSDDDVPREAGAETARHELDNNTSGHRLLDNPIRLGIAVGALFATIGIVAVLWIVVWKSESTERVPVIAQKEQKTQVKPEQKGEKKEKAPDLSLAKTDIRKDLAEMFEDGAEEDQPKPAETPEPEPYENAWNADIKQRGGIILLPAPPSQTATEVPQPEEIVRLDLSSPADCQLRLISAEGVSEDGQGLFVKADVYGGGSSRTWSVTRVSINPLSASAPRKETPIGRFQLDQDVLKFQWHANTPSWANPLALRYSLLEITVEDQSETCRLSEPQPSEDARLGLDSDRTHKAFVGISSKAVGDPKRLMLDLAFSGFPRELPPIAGMSIGEKKSIRIEGTKQHGDETVEIEIAFLSDFENAPFLQFEAFINAREISLDLADLDKITKLAQTSSRNLNTSALERLGTELRKISLREARVPGPVLTEDFDAFKSKLVPIRFKIGRLCEAVDRQFSEARLRTLQQGRGPVGDKDIRKAREVARSRFQSSVDALRGVHSDLERKAGPWCDVMKRRFETIQEKAAIAYAVYVEVAGQRVYLAVSESFPEEMRQP